jgi:GTP-binding protein YchF
MFNALTRNNVLAAKYRFATIEANTGIVGVPDPRLKVLAEMHNAEKIIPATVSFVDIAGIVKGASRGEGMGNAFLASIREADAICQVTRVFADDDVTAMEGEVNPLSDIDTITTELILADLQTIEKAMPRLEKDLRIKKEPQSKMDAWQEALDVLNDGRTVFAAGLDPEPLRDLWLLTAKPFIYVFNCDQDSLADEEMLAKIRDFIAPAEPIFLDAKFESEVVSMDEDEAREFLAEMGVEEPGLDQLARVGYATLGLQSFLTAGPKEVRAWTIRQGWTAPLAAGVIHTDFQKKFIKAEVVTYEDLIELGSMAAARTAGKARIEGKEYVMQPSDVVEFRHG